MMRAFMKFNKGILKMPVALQLWLMLLVSVNLIAPLFFWNRLEAQVVLVAFLASVTLMTFLTGRFGFTRIVGLGHIFWVPLLAFLLARLANVPTGDAYGLWIRAVIVLDGISLVIDAVDAIRYIGGDRRETVAGL